MRRVAMGSISIISLSAGRVFKGKLMASSGIVIADEQSLRSRWPEGYCVTMRLFHRPTDQQKLRQKEEVRKTTKENFSVNRSSRVNVAFRALSKIAGDREYTESDEVSLGSLSGLSRRA